MSTIDNNDLAEFLGLDAATTGSPKPGAKPASGSAGDRVTGFVQEYMPMAQRVADRIGVEPHLLLGQWGLETGWGRSVIPGTKNLGNIKRGSSWTGRTVEATDNDNGSRDPYRAYDSDEGFADDFVNLLERRYKGALNSGDNAAGYFSALKAGKYAEDAAYISKGVSAARRAREAMAMIPADKDAAVKPRYADRPNQAEAAPRGIGSILNDSAIDVGNAAVGLVKAGVDLFAPDSAASEAISGFIKDGQDKQSDWKKDSRNQLQEALAVAGENDGSTSGRVGAQFAQAGAYLQHSFVNDPIGMISEIVGNIGPFAMLGGSMKAAKLADGVRTAIASGVAGGLSAGEVRGNIWEEISSQSDADLMEASPAYAQLRKDGMDEAAAKSELGANLSRNLPEVAVVGLIGALSGKYGVEGMAAGVAPKYAGSRLASTGIGFLDEGVIQGGSEQVGSNVGVQRVIPGKDLMEGVGQNMAAEGLPGAGMGAAFGGQGAVAQPDPKPSGPLSRAALAGGAPVDGGPAPANPAAVTDKDEHTTASEDPITARANAIEQQVREGGLLEQLREIGQPDRTVPEFLDALTAARNPNVSPEVRAQAMESLEMAMGWIADGAMPSDPAAGSPVSTELSVPGGEPTTGTEVAPAGEPEFFDPDTIDVDAVRVDNMIGGPRAIEGPRDAQAADASGEPQAAAGDAQGSPAAEGGTKPSAPLALAAVRRPVPLPKVATPAGTTPAFQRQEAAQIRAAVEQGFDTVERRGDGVYLVNAAKNQESKLSGLGAMVRARKIVSDYVSERANAAATSPTNDRREPTAAQIDAMNWKKGDRFKLNGFEVVIENPKDSTRKSKPGAEQTWETKMVAHYGDLAGTTGADGDPVDVFIGPRPDLDTVFVVDQLNPRTGRFDEHKVMMGYPTIEAARAGYLANYEAGWQGLGDITEMPLGDFRKWVRSDAAKRPAAGYSASSGKQGDADGQGRDGVLAAEGVSNPVGSVPGDAVPGDAAGAAQDGGRGGRNGPAAAADGDAGVVRDTVDQSQRAGRLGARNPANEQLLIQAFAERHGLDVRPADPSSDATQSLNALLDVMASLTGKRGIAVDMPPDAIGAFDGVADDGEFFVNVNRPHVHVATTIAHEFKHLTEQIPSFARVYDRIWEMIPVEGRRDYYNRYLAPSDKRLAPRYENAGPRGIHVLKLEMVADFIGKRFNDRKWLEQLAQRKPALFGDFVRDWVRVLDEIAQRLRTLVGLGGETERLKNVDRYITDIEQAKSLAMEAVELWATQYPRIAQERGYVGGEAMFSARDDDFTGFDLDTDYMDAEMQRMLQGELAAEAASESAAADADAIDPKALKAAGLMAEQAFGDLYWEQNGDEAWRQVARIPNLVAEGKTTKIEIEQNVDGLWRADMLGTWVGPAAAEADGFATEQGVKDFVARQVAAVALARSGFDLADALPKAQAAKALKAWKAVGKIGHGEIANPAYRFGRADKRASTLKEIAAGMGITENYNLGVFIDQMDPETTLYNLTFTHKISGKSYSALLELHKKAGQKFFTANTIELGRSGMGAAVYQMAADFAARRGIPLRPESSLSGVNSYRRTEQMISAALRSGKSNAMVPHPTQRVYGFDDNAASDSAHNQNLTRLVLASLRNVRELAPEVEELIYFPETDAFTFLDGEDAKALVDEILSRTDARAFGLGRTQLARAALTQQFMQGEQPAGQDEFAANVLYSARLSEEMEYQAVVDQYKGTEQWLKAPNGLNTKLTQRQWAQVRTPSFRKWFGDWEKYATMEGGVWNDASGEVSKVVDTETGEPLVVYHGTDKGGFLRFKGATGASRGQLGIFTTPNYEMASSYVRRGRRRDIELPTSRQDLEDAGFQFEEQEDGKVQLIDTDGYVNDTYDSEAEAVQAAIREFGGDTGVSTVYELFANLREVTEESFRGALFNGDYTGDSFEVYDSDGDIAYTEDGRDIMTRDEARDLAESIGGSFEEASPLPFTSDSVAREALSLKQDGAILRNIIDDGGGAGGYYGDPTDVFVIFDAANVKSAEFNSGEFGTSDDIRFSAREPRMNEVFGDFRGRSQKDGSLVVAGDPVEIRAPLPDGIKGRAVNGGLLFSASDAPRVKAALDGRKLTYSRAGAILSRKPTKDGEYVGAPEKFNTPAKIPTLRRWLKQLAKEGERGRYWYENSSREVLRMVGGNVREARKFVALLAIYSPQAKVDANSTFALRAWAQHKAGQPISVKTSVMDNKAQGAMDDVDAFWSGEKTGNFFFNLLREIDPTTAGKQGATIDMWMMRAGQYENDAPTPNQYAFMEDETNRLAADLGWEPQQVQAAIWVAMKARMENPGVKKITEQTSEKKGFIYYVPGKDGKGKVRQIVKGKEKNHRDNWLKYAFAHEPTASDTEQAKFDFSDGVLRHVGQISFEARPGRTTDVLPGIHDAPYAQQVEFQQAVHAAFHDERGVDMLAMRLGLLVDNDIMVPGVWQGDVSPSTQTTAAMAPSKGPDGKTKVDPAQASLLNVYASIAGLFARQEGVGWHRPFYTASKRDSNALDIDLGRPVTPEEAADIEVAVDRWMAEAGRPDWQDGFAFVSSPYGIRVVNFGSVSNAELHSEITRLMERVLPDFGYRLFASDGAMPTNKWKENPDGQSYIQRIRAEGRSDVLDWASVALAPRIQSVFEEFSRKYGWGNPGRVPTLAEQPAERGRGRDARYSSRIIAPLAGAPTAEGATGPDQRLVQVAESYARAAGIKLRRQAEYVDVDPRRAWRIAAAYEAMAHDPGNPVVKEAFENLVRQTTEQYRALEAAGYKFWLFDEGSDPYAGNPWNAMRDLRANASMGVFATESGFGSGATEIDVADNPLLADTGIKWPFGSPGGKRQRVLANDLFRAVHDAFGHGLEGAGFRARGEENAWQAHARLFTGSALGALTSETRGQNSWLNFGPFAEKNAAAKVEDTVFADQKTGLMPAWTWTEGRVGDAPAAETSDTRFSARVPGELFFSELSRQVEKASMKQAAPGAWKQFIKALSGKGVKADEIEWTGINDWLDLQTGKVAKDDVLTYLRGNGVQVGEVVLGATGLNAQGELSVDIANNDGDEWAVFDEEGRLLGGTYQTEAEALDAMAQMQDDLPTKYSQYTLPGGSNYRELLLTLPVKSSADLARAEYEDWAQRNSLTPNATMTEQRYERETGKKAPPPRTMTAMESDRAKNYKSSHWDQANILAHIRVDDRVDAEGARVLFVNELQSDWGQQGRKDGFVGENSGLTREQAAAIKARYNTLQTERPRIFQGQMDVNAMMLGMGVLEIEEAFAAAGIDPSLASQVHPQSGTVPRAPFVNTTDGWLNLALRRVIGLAVDEGYDKVAFINGDQSADLYDLSKQIDRIDYSQNPDGSYNLSAIKNRQELIAKEDLTIDEIEGLVGKDVAKKIASGEGEDAGTVDRWEPEDATPIQMRSLSGLDLKVGGQGMRTFYDSIVPNAVKALVKKFGGEIADVKLQVRDSVSGDQKFTYSTLTEAWGDNYVVDERTGKKVAGPFDTWQEASNWLQRNDPVLQSTQPGLVITKPLREKVGDGMPMFSARANQQTKTAEFKKWFGDSKVVDAEGKPLVVYRGEHGGGDGQPRTMLGSITFTNDPRVASIYAEDPNDRTMFDDAQSPNVIPAYLSIKNPVINTPNDPFMEFSDVIRAIGLDEAMKLARKHDDYVRQTSAWDEGFADDFNTVGDLLDAKPESLSELYVQAYPILDDVDFVKAVKEAGFDGAIYKGSGASMNAIEYRVFSSEQIKSAIGNGGGFDPSNPDIRFSARATEAGDKAGFDTSKTWYHGTASKDFKGFKAGKGGVDELGAGIYFTGDPDVAQAWAGRHADQGGRIIPVYLKKGDIFDSTVMARKISVRSPDLMSEYLLPLARRIKANNPVSDAERQAKKIRAKSVTTWTPEESRIVNDTGSELWRTWLLESDLDLAKNILRGNLNTWLDRAGYIGRKNDNSQIADQVVVFRPENVRSPWARFNPNKADSSNILMSARVTDTPEFKKWFSDSKVVDEKGKPLVVYHGTFGEFSAFRTNTLGAFFTTSQVAAEEYGDNVIGAYIALHRPLVLDAKGAAWSEIKYTPELKKLAVSSGLDFKGYEGGQKIDTDTLARLARMAGHDGLIIKNVDDADGMASSTDSATVVVSFDPKQIKSATGNNGGFDGGNPDIRFSTRTNPNGAWSVDDSTWFDDFVFKAQDKLIDLKRVIESIRKTGGQIVDDINAYMQEELFHGRAAKQVEDFGRQELEPLIQAIADAGLTLADVEEYLHARHAEEANDVIAQRNPGDPGLQDGGSGMKTADARAYLAALSPDMQRKLASIAGRVDGIIGQTRQLYVDFGLEDQAVVDGWGTLFKHYIPLQREDKGGGMGIGQGFSVKGKVTKSRTGSTRKVVDILANIAMQRERLIVRGEKNRVAQALVGLAWANPNADFWEVRSQAPTERVYDPKTNTVIDRPDGMFKQQDNVLTAKVKDSQGNVTEQAIVFNEDNPRAVRLAMAMKNIDAGKLEGLLSVSAKITRYFSSINTQYNPVFGVVNLIRDVQGAMINLGGTPLAGQRLQIAKDTMKALAGIYGDIRKTRKGGQATSQWAVLWEDFQQTGGKTGFRELFKTSKDRAEGLQEILTPDGWMDSGLGKVFTANGTLRVPMSQAKKGADWIFNWLSDYNEAMENGVRLAAYKAGLDQGMTKKQAASLAKNLTVNFNRRGQIGMQMGAVYAFFNAAMQGTARIGQALVTMDEGKVKTMRLSKTGKQVVYGGILLGSIQALMLALAGFDDEDPPEFMRERSLIIPTGGKTYISIPMPLGLHVIPGIGRHFTEFALSGFEKPAARVVSMVGMFADAFNPIGNAGLSMQTLAPTVLDPLVALTENKDWSGRPIARASFNKATPGHTLHKDTASTIAKLMAEGINTVTGGNEYVAGALSPTPDQIDYLIGQVTGGVGRELSKVEQSSLATLRGEDLPIYKIPLAGRFFGNAAGQSSEGSAFYAHSARLNELETEVKGLRADGKVNEANELLKSRPDAYLIAVANAAERQVQRLRKEKKNLINAGASRELVKGVEVKITEAMSRLNRAAEKAEALEGR